MMLDFYGARLVDWETGGAPAPQAAARCSTEQQNGMARSALPARADARRVAGELARGDAWRERFANLCARPHNFLRITRILKCLGEVGLERSLPSAPRLCPVPPPHARAAP
jgi:hypothetical protein